MKIQSKQALKYYDQKDIIVSDKPLTIGEALSNILTDAKEGGRMKLFLLATKFYNHEDVDVDESDLNIIKQAVKSTVLYNNLINGQLELFLENLKDKTVSENS